MSATISYNGFAPRGGSPHARKHSTIVASTLIQRVPSNDAPPLNCAATIGVSLAPSADLLKSLFAPSGSVTQRGKRKRARLHRA